MSDRLDKSWIGKCCAHAHMEKHAMRRVWSLSIPCYLISLVLAMPLALFFRSWHLRRRLIRAGCCPECDYDLRATPHGCPESGAIALSASAPSRASPAGAPISGVRLAASWISTLACSTSSSIPVPLWRPRETRG